jgi:hypothetical protein
LQAIEINNATESTALAIYHATDNINHTNQLNLNANLRLSNLEKSFKRNEQRNNELINKQKRQKTQKTSTGSHTTEPMASPTQMALSKQEIPILDLTGDHPIEGATHQWKANSGRPNRGKMRQRKNIRTQDPEKKFVQWKSAEIRNFNPAAPVSTTPATATWNTPDTTAQKTSNLPQFHPAQLPPPPPAPNTLATPIYIPIQMGHFNPLLQQQIYPASYYAKPQEQLTHPFQPLQQFSNLSHVSTRENPFGTQNLLNKK